jgi:hypothetical protein
LLKKRLAQLEVTVPPLDGRISSVIAGGGIGYPSSFSVILCHQNRFEKIDR